MIEAGGDRQVEQAIKRLEDEVVRLWDALNASLDRWKILAEFPVQGVRIPELIPADGLSQGIRRWRGGPGTAVELDSAGWKQWIQGWSDQGWTVPDPSLR